MRRLLAAAVAAAGLVVSVPSPVLAVSCGSQSTYATSTSSWNDDDAGRVTVKVAETVWSLGCSDGTDIFTDYNIRASASSCAGWSGVVVNARPRAGVNIGARTIRCVKRDGADGGRLVQSLYQKRYAAGKGDRKGGVDGRIVRTGADISFVVPGKWQP